MLNLDKIIIPAQNINDEIFEPKNIKLTIARFDLINGVVSGNKLYKLFYFLREAFQKNKSIVTYGGAYSNHLIATAFACKSLNIKCKGIVNGEEPVQLSGTLKKCLEYGMQLEFISRKEFRIQKYNCENLKDEMHIPEGGFNITGKDGAALMWNQIKDIKADYLCIPVGSATTLAGIMSVADTKEIIAFPAIKNMNDIYDRLNELNVISNSNLVINNEFHFGGFAKKNDVLLTFIKNFKLKHNIPLDFIYTGKMMYAIFEMVKSGYFLNNSHILVFHTGGLQGNPENLFQ